MLKTQICIAMTDVPKNEPERNLSSAASYPVGLGLRGNNLPGSFSRDNLTASDRGLWMNGLKAGEATTAAARILIEEMLGFHTVTSQSAGDFFQKLLTGWQLRTPMSS